MWNPHGANPPRARVGRGCSGGRGVSWGWGRVRDPRHLSGRGGGDLQRSPSGGGGSGAEEFNLGGIVRVLDTPKQWQARQLDSSRASAVRILWRSHASVMIRPSRLQSRNLVSLGLGATTFVRQSLAQTSKTSNDYRIHSFRARNLYL